MTDKPHQYQKALRATLILGLVGGLLVGYIITRGVYELGYQVRGLCGECGRPLR